MKLNGPSIKKRTESLKAKTTEVRRQHILEAAVKVFAERGFHRSTIRDVAVQAGVSDGAIYNVLSNKQALLLGMLEPLRETSAGDIPREAGLIGIVHAMLTRRWFSFTPQILPMLRIVLSEVLVDRKLRKLFTERVIAPVLEIPAPVFEGLRTSGHLASADVRMSLRLMTASFMGMLLLRLLDDDFLEARTAKIPDALADLLLEGMRPRNEGSSP